MASGISPVETPEVPELSEKEKLSLSLNRLPPINSSQQTNPTLFLAQPVATQQANGQPAYILQPNGQSEYMLQANVQSANGQPGTSNVLQGQQLFATTSFTGEMTQQSVYILRPQPLPASEQAASKTWVIVGILSTIFCCFPLGLAGTIMAHMSREDAARGDAGNHRRRLCQAKALTGTAIGIGGLTLIALAVSFGLIFGLLINQGNDYEYEPIPSLTWTDKGIYLGCYEDDQFHRDVSGINTEFEDDNDVDKCVYYCASHGYKYAGLQDYSKCYCGNTYGSNGKASEDSCYATCPGNSDETCGGYLTNSIYRTNFIGCFIDDDKRSLKGYSYVITSSDELKDCVETCGYEGYEFAGLQDSNKCNCGQDPNRYGEALATECNTPCAQNPELTCGGTFRNSVYKTYVNAYSGGHNLGCYTDEPSDRDLTGYYRYLPNNNSVSHCNDICSARGFQYSGVQGSNECFCSRDYGSHGSVSESYCNISCSLYTWQKCGGVVKNRVARTNYLGCFEDNLSHRALNESILLDRGFLPDDCRLACENQGYFFAGIQSGDKCYCGYDVNRYRQVTDEECDIPCIGDSEVMCGGHLRNSVYKTFIPEIVY